MSKIKMKKTLTRTFPRVPVYDQVREYLTSVATAQQTLSSGYEPEKGDTNPNLQLVLSQALFSEVNADLGARKQFYKKERVVLNQEWEDLEEKERALRDNFVKLNKFIQGNKEKRQRAAERLHEDIKTVKKTKAHIEQLKKDYADLEEIKLLFDKEIAAHRLYQEYLYQTMKLSNEFKNPFNIIDRYESLMATKAELGQRQTHALESLEFAKLRLSKKADENNLAILGFSNVLSSFVSRYQLAVATSLQWERIVNNIKNNSLNKYKEITEVKQCCRNTYLLMCRRKGEVPKIPEDNVEKQLVYIKKTLKQLASVRTEAASRTKETFSSVRVELSKLT
ncbi:hypothetical protein Zmor_017799 [Zophobas morio]|uniref:DUF4200 domain-containing protein n=1 Tax=Zophobas morio TaxID=2755281 RepID=A0AA38MCI4_9CUCU|nr:hypothetical protein Zmor_017799 [Zophobas morio]